MKKEFDTVRCLKSGYGFIKNHLYAQIGWNNGLTVFRETDNGDHVELLLHSYGDGLWPVDFDGNQDDKPKFDIYISMTERIKRKIMMRFRK